MQIRVSTKSLLDALIGWQGAAASTRSRLLESFCSGIRGRSLVSNSITALIVAVFIIADTRHPAHMIWLLFALLGGLMPRAYAARLRRHQQYGRNPERIALHFIAISAIYGSIWGIGPLLLLPDIHGTSVGLLLIIIIFGTIMGPYAAMPGILYARLVTTGIPTLIAIALYTDTKLTVVSIVLAGWLVLRTDVWRGYHRILRRQMELREALETQQRKLEETNRAKQRANEDLRVMAETDPLTGIANRRHFMKFLNQLTGPAALVLFDIDRFKTINDTLGHHAGDALLLDLVGVAHQHLRKEDLLARLGGDEFAIVLPGVSESSAWTIAERIRQSVAQHATDLGGDTVCATISLGIAAISEEPSAADPSMLLRAADLALYAAKNQGRNRTHCTGSDDERTLLGA